MKVAARTRARGTARAATRHRRAAPSVGRADAAFERQADDVAARAMRPSERAAARGLARAPAARAPLTTSPGSPLPAAPRRLLEQRLGADLAAVRIHTSAEAAAAAIAEGAVAFAAGAHLYFAPGAFDPDMPSGLAVLAHEVAHALQQTGYTDAAGLVHATNRQGDGPLQPIVGAMFPTVKRPTIDVLLGDNAHLEVLVANMEARFGKDPSLARAVAWFLDELTTHDGGTLNLSSTSPPSVALANLVAKITAGVDGGQGGGRSFVVDLLALTDGGPGEEYWKAAAKVLWRDEEHDVVFRFHTRHVPFLQWLRINRNDDYFARSLSHPRIQPWFDDLFNAYAEILIDGRAQPRALTGFDPTTSTQATFAEQAATLMAEMKAGPTLSPRDLEAWNIVGEMDRDRLALVKAWDQAFKDERARRLASKQTLVGFEVRAFAAGLVRTHFQDDKWSKRVTVWKDYAARLVKLATTVEDFLTRGLSRYATLRAATWSVRDLIAADAAKTFAGGLDRTPELDALGAILTKHAAALFGAPTAAPPAPADYDALVTAFKTELESHYAALTSALVSKFFVTPDATISTTHAWVLIWTFEALEFLAQSPYDLAKDLADRAVTDRKTMALGQAEDLRRYHRHLLAVLLLRVARFAGFTDVAAAAGAMAVSDNKSRLLILEDWKETDDPPSKLLADFPSSGGRYPIRWVSAAEAAAASTATPPRPPREVDAPFTYQQLINYFGLAYLQTLNTEVEAVLDATYQGPIDAKTAYSLAPVVAAAKRLKRPRRWVPGKHAIFVNPNDPVRYTVGDLIALSDKTAHQVRRDALGALIRPRGGAFQEAPVFEWVVPDLTPMVTFLRANVPLLDKLIADATGKAAPAAVDDWIFELGKVADDAFKARVLIWEAIRDTLHDAKVGFDFERTRLLKNSRHLSALRRQVIKARAAELLKQWKDRPRGGMAGKIAFYKEEALDLARAYRAEVEPATDWEAQVAALWLDLGPSLDDTFADGEHIPPDIMPMMELALAAAKAQRAGRPQATTSLAAPVLIEDVVGRGGETTASILAGETALASVLAKLVRYLESQQTKQGFYADGDHFGTYRYAATFPIKGEFSWDGRHYRIKAIHRSFAYHPPVGGVPSILKESQAKGAKDIPRDQAIPLFTIDIDDEAAPLGLPTPRTWNLAGPSAEGIPEERAARRVLPPLSPTASQEEVEARELLAEKYKDETQLEKETGRYVVTSADDKLLTVIAFAVELSAMNEGLQRTAEVMGGFMEVVITAAEIILPGGQAILLVELLAGAVDAVTNPEMVELIETVRQDPTIIIDLLKDRLTNLVTPDTLWDILFDDGLEGLSVFGPFAKIVDEARGKRTTKGKLPASKTTNRARPRGRLGRIVQFIIGLGRRFLRAFRLLKLKFKGPLNRLRAAVVTRPKLAWVLVKAMHFLSRAEQLLSLGLGELGKEAGEEAGNDAKAEVTNFAEHISEMELPSELVPLDLLYGQVLSFILSKIPKVKLIRPILDAAGWTDKIAGRIAEYIGVKDSWADPNSYWKQLLVPALEKPFMDIKRELVHSMVGLINDVGQHVGFQITLPTDAELGPSTPTLVPAEELEEYPSDEPALGGTVAVPHDSGRPLDAGTLSSAERHFGQDFSHVRVHADASAAVFTAALGAEAATSGSHVYLGATAAAASGGDVLHHELGHVIQQTGDRPVGGEHSDTPVRGEAGRGLTYDPGREAEADRMAASGASAVATRGPDAAPALQPRLSTAVLQKAIGSITRFRPGGGQFKALAATAADVPGAARAKKVWVDVVALLPTKKARFEKFLSDTAVVKPAIIDRITTPISNSDVVAVAAMAQRKLPGKTTPSGEAETTLNPRFFITLLQGFVFAKTGVVVDIEATHTDSTTTIDGVKVKYVHLPFVPYGSDSGKRLWDRVMKTTGLVTVADGKDGATKIRRLLSAQLGARRPEPFLWDTSDPAFVLSAMYVKEFRALIDASKGRGRPTKVEDAKDYAATDLSSKPSQSGLRVATHGELTASGHPERSDRDSHHVPQFLLVEFFRNRNAEKAWPEPPGGSAASTNYGKALGLVGVAKPPRIDHVQPGGHLFRLKDPLDKNESERGVGLPSVLLAMETHTKGPLHLDDHKDEIGDQGPQSRLIKSKWLNLLPSPLKADFSVDGWNEHFKSNRGDASKVADAMIGTYQWLFKMMKGSLRDALIDFEKPYYEGLAAELGNVDKKDNLLEAYKLDTSLINAVVKAVVDKNTAIMSDWK